MNRMFPVCRHGSGTRQPASIPLFKDDALPNAIVIDPAWICGPAAMHLADEHMMWVLISYAGYPIAVGKADPAKGRPRGWLVPDAMRAEQEALVRSPRPGIDLGIPS